MVFDCTKLEKEETVVQIKTILALKTSQCFRMLMITNLWIFDEINQLWDRYCTSKLKNVAHLYLFIVRVRVDLFRVYRPLWIESGPSSLLVIISHATLFWDKNSFVDMSGALSLATTHPILRKFPFLYLLLSAHKSICNLCSAFFTVLSDNVE